MEWGGRGKVWGMGSGECGVWSGVGREGRRGGKGGREGVWVEEEEEGGGEEKRAEE